MNSDFTDSEKIARRMMEATAMLHKLAPKVAQSRTIKEFVGDLKKNLLAKYVVRSLKAGESATAAEAIGRADPDFQRELAALQEQHGAAESTLSSWTAEQCSYEAARSLLSFSKATLQELNG